MFKLSFMSCIAPHWDFTRLAEVANELNYQGIEFRVGAGQKHGLEIDAPTALLKTHKEQLASLNLKVAGLASSIFFSPNFTAQQQLDINNQVIAHCQLATKIGAPVIRVSAKSFSDESELENLAQALRLAAEAATDYGITLALETTGGLTSARKVQAVLEKVALTNVGALWDVYHTTRSGESLTESYGLLQPYLRHLHLNQLTPQKRVLSLSQPAPPVDYPALFKLLGAGNFNGFVSGEWLGVAESLAFELLKNNRQLLQNWFEVAGV
jgi:sugar phosphate isomerase/epimerase